MNKLLLAVIAFVALIGIALLWNVQAGAVPVGIPLTNTPAAPQGERGASFDLPQAPANLHNSDSPAQAQSQMWELDQPVQDANRIAASLQRAQALRQMEWHFPLPETAGPLSVGPAGVSCADMLANSAMDIVKTGPTTGTIDSWVVLAHNIYYDDASGYYNSPYYSLVMADEPPGYDDVLCSEAVDCDAFGQAFKAPTNLVSVTIKYSRLYENENTADYSGYELWTLDNEGYLDEVIGSWGIGAGTGWSNRQATLDPTQVISASGKMLALVFYMESDRTAPAEFVWLDDAQVTACFSVGARKVYLPLVIKQPSPSVVACVPYEPDNRDTRGSTVINAVCSGTFGPSDDKDYYTLDLRGVSNVRLQLTNLPAGTNWDAMIYEYPYAGQPPACHIATPGDQNKYRDCTLNLAKNYFVLVSAGAAPSTQKGYQMAVVDMTPLPVTPTPTTPPSTWTIITSENFEGGFPSSGWVVNDSSGTTDGEYYWYKRNCRPFAGSYSGWAVGGGANGGSLACGSNYPSNARSWMVYGPFSLVGATAADFKLKLWLNTELNYDGACWMASVDGNNFSGSCSTGNSNGWVDRSLDLSNVYSLGNLLGRSQVWVALVFTSDSSVVKTEGAYADEVVLRKCMSASCPAMYLASPDPENSQLVEFPATIQLK